MKFSIRTTPTPTNEGWTVSVTCPKENVEFDDRELRRCGNMGEGFPVPVIALESVKGQPHEALCDPQNNDPSNLQKLYDSIIIGDLAEGDSENFGKYLTAVLLGENWASMLAAADNEPIELELHFNCRDKEMNRLPWELMYSDTRPFGGYAGRDVAITRIVPSETKPSVEPLTLPLKVLFVIGRQIDDKLRPGAEYLGMLRRMKIPFMGTPEPRSINLNTRLLTEATREELRSAIVEFRPHIVHFICHGVVDGDGGRILLTKPIEEQEGSELEADECNAEQLLEDMSDGKAPNNLPQIVVLNACHTADGAQNGERSAASDIKGSYLAMAAEFVAGGVSVAIGMAGEIADAACRIFTRNFYQALIKREPIALATASGRRAAIYYYRDYYTKSVEWMRPTLFAADNVLDELTVSAESQEAMLRLAEIPSKYLEDRNLLCDHFSCLKAYQRFRLEIDSASERKMLAFRVIEQESKQLKFGKTRLLEEIAAQSVLDNLIPCLIRNGGTVEPPTNLLNLTILLAGAMETTRGRFSVPRRGDSYAYQEAFKLFGLTADPGNPIEYKKAVAHIKAKFKDLGNPGEPADHDPEVAKAIILMDFQQLYDDINNFAAAGKPNENAAGKVPSNSKPRKLLLLLDDLHLYEGVAPVLLSDAMTGEYGLGDESLPIPVIFTYSAHSLTKALEEIEAVVRRGKYVGKHDLRRITDLAEARLAYSQYLLSREAPLSFNWLNSKKPDVDVLLEVLHKAISGVPSLFYQDKVENFLELAQASRTLLEADDEKIMQHLRNLDANGIKAGRPE
ncbi:MAG TPA: CHAT domain-containing protein [Pyrinomonadaceae bacterium]|nr:CHAT domain-containing protein [Pyrinomonadaceae bacterium]